MKEAWGWTLGMAVLVSMPRAIAAEYEGRNIDGRTFEAQVFSYETGGLYDIQVEFRKKRAIMTFAGGSKQKIRLRNPVITNPQQIEGWGRPGLTFGIFSIGLADDSTNNLQSPRPRPLEGFWRIRIRAEDLRE